MKKLKIKKFLDSDGRYEELIFEKIKGENILIIEYKNKFASDKEKRYALIQLDKKITKEFLNNLENNSKYFACISRTNFCVMEIEKEDFWYVLRIYDLTFFYIDRLIRTIKIYLTEEEMNKIKLFIKKVLNEKENEICGAS